MATHRPDEQPRGAVDLPDWDTVYERQRQRADLAREWLDALALRPGERVLGGHAVMAVGYDDEQRHFITRNSWGSGWGQDGYFLMPYHYLHDPNLAADFWTVRMISAPAA